MFMLCRQVFNLLQRFSYITLCILLQII
uniref:Uncharacterized protein n=1 Tax=Arundo donax TaxID=35708 RepID=A0A0A9B1W7_ARUDO